MIAWAGLIHMIGSSEDLRTSIRAVHASLCPIETKLLTKKETNMTEEEKKEFEEFLQWKAERTKKQETEGQSQECKDEAEIEEGTQFVVSEGNRDSPDFQDDRGKKALPLLLVITAILILFFVGIAISNMRPSPKSVEFVDSIAVVPVAEPERVSEPVVNAKQDSINRAERISAVKKTIKITSAYLSRPNSASGVDVYFYYKNMSDKTIKYLVWEGYPMNAVGDRVSCEIRGYRDYRGQDTGPVKPGRKSGGCWGCAWYNSTARKLVLTGIEIEYMDGTTFTIKESEIDYIR